MWPCGVQGDSDGLLIPKVWLALTCEIDIILKDVYWWICVLLRSLRLFPHVALQGTGEGGGGQEGTPVVHWGKLRLVPILLFQWSHWWALRICNSLRGEGRLRLFPHVALLWNPFNNNNNNNIKIVVVVVVVVVVAAAAIVVVVNVSLV